MKPTSSRPWWLRKRILFPLLLLAGVAVTGVIAYFNSAASTIVIYNETGNPLPPLLVRAGDQTRTFPALADQESIRIALKPGGGESAVHLELATEPPWKWDGATIQPRGGQRVTIRLWPDGQVEAFTEISWWQKTFN
jgi:hypothetical protein